MVALSTYRLMTTGGADPPLSLLCPPSLLQGRAVEALSTYLLMETQSMAKSGSAFEPEGGEEEGGEDDEEGEEFEGEEEEEGRDGGAGASTPAAHADGGPSGSPPSRAPPGLPPYIANAVHDGPPLQEALNRARAAADARRRAGSAS